MNIKEFLSCYLIVMIVYLVNCLLLLLLGLQAMIVDLYEFAFMMYTCSERLFIGMDDSAFYVLNQYGRDMV